MNASSPGDFLRLLTFLLAGPLVWFTHFSLIYGTVGFAAAFGFAPADIRLITWSATFAAIVALLVVLWEAQPSRLALAPEAHRPTLQMVRPLTGLALVAVLLEALVLCIVPR